MGRDIAVFSFIYNKHCGQVMIRLRKNAKRLELITEKQMKQTSKRVTEEMIMNSQNKISQSQKLMVFVLSMSLYGLATLFTELIPSFQVGIVEFSVEYFLFIPLTLAMLFDPLSAGLGAATGELVFSEIMLDSLAALVNWRNSLP